MAGQAGSDFFRFQGLGQLQLADLLAADDAERQRQGEDEARLGVEALGLAHRQFGAAQQALEGAHEIVVAEEAEVGALAEAEADLAEGTGRLGRRPGGGQGFR